MSGAQKNDQNFRRANWSALRVSIRSPSLAISYAAMRAIAPPKYDQIVRRSSANTTVYPILTSALGFTLTGSLGRTGAFGAIIAPSDAFGAGAGSSGTTVSL